MRDFEPIPAWVSRQRSRRLGRHSDEKVVRWISVQQVKDRTTEGAVGPLEPAYGGNLLTFPTRLAV